MSTPLPRRTALRSAAAAAVVLAAGPLAACSVVEGATDGKPGDAAEGQEGAGSPVTLRGAGAVGAVDPAGAGLDENIVALQHELARARGRQRNPVLLRLYLLRDADPHGARDDICSAVSESAPPRTPKRDDS